jgi:hypothetical protein
MTGLLMEKMNERRCCTVTVCDPASRIQRDGVIIRLYTPFVYEVVIVEDEVK